MAFQQLVDGPLPMLYRCTAGKDRTGIFSALVPLSLGVPESTVVKDYTLTNKYLTAAGQKQMAAASGNHELTAISPAQARVLMASDPEVLRNALAAAQEKYGSFDNYRRQALNISDEDLEKVKSRLLTK
jgi:protein-tyrosine phosphatase